MRGNGMKERKVNMRKTEKVERVASGRDDKEMTLKKADKGIALRGESSEKEEIMNGTGDAKQVGKMPERKEENVYKMKNGKQDKDIFCRENGFYDGPIDRVFREEDMETEGEVRMRSVSSEKDKVFSFFASDEDAGIPEIREWLMSAPKVSWDVLQAYWKAKEAEFARLICSDDAPGRLSGRFAACGIQDEVSRQTGVCIGDLFSVTGFNRDTLASWIEDWEAFVQKRGFIPFEFFALHASPVLQPLMILRGEVKFGDVVYEREDDEFNPARLSDIVYDGGTYFALLKDGFPTRLNELYAEPRTARTGDAMRRHFIRYNVAQWKKYGEEAKWMTDEEMERKVEEVFERLFGTGPDYRWKRES